MQPKTRIELLSPCKNWKSLQAATMAEADAVYFGTHVLNLRRGADNFDLKELPEVVEYCHDKGVKAHVTLNSIIYDNELDVLDGAMGQVKEAGADAVIVNDVAAIESAIATGMDFHVSTQANVSNLRAARHYEKLGASRIILARELSLDKISAIAKAMDTAGIEVFIHGAMCTSVSGRCYFSLECMGSDAHSGNRGACVQPCRRRWRVIDEENNEFIYNGQMFINTKDLCMIEHVPALLESGVVSLKIEGRMRDPVYVETVTACYREAIEACHDGTYTQDKVNGWLERLEKVFNRGFTTGFYFGRPTADDVEHDIRGNVSKHRSIEIGYVADFFSKASVAKIVLTNGRLKIGEEIHFMGRGSRTYCHQVIESMRVHGKDVVETPVGTSKNHVLVSVKTNEVIKENDRVYVFTDDTYENFKKGRDRKQRYKRY